MEEVGFVVVFVVIFVVVVLCYCDCQSAKLSRRNLHLVLFKHLVLFILSFELSGWFRAIGTDCALPCRILLYNKNCILF